MAKNNKQGNYITQQIQKFGENWLASQTPEIIQSNGKRIIKEMVNNKFNYEQVGKYFLDLKFLDNLIIFVQNELEINTVYFNAVAYYKQCFPAVPNIAIHENHLSCMCYIYSIILSRLEGVRDTGNLSILLDIATVLYQYKNHLS